MSQWRKKGWDYRFRNGGATGGLGVFCRLAHVNVALLITCAVNLQAASHYQRLKSFGAPDFFGGQPMARLIEASDGWLYGTTASGGVHGGGTVFRINTNGSGFAVLHDFNRYAGDAGLTEAPVFEAGDGVLYGTSWWGGTNAAGTIFRLKKDGSGYRILYHFKQTNGDGFEPKAGLVEGAPGVLYGSAGAGGTENGGTLFRINTDGNGYQILHHFFTAPDFAEFPVGALLKGSDGKLYGVTSAGGIYQGGSVFRLDPADDGYIVLHSFGGPIAGSAPTGELLEASNGMLYGGISHGLFALNKDGSNFTLIAPANSIPTPNDHLVEGSDGALYWTSRFGGTNQSGAVYRIAKEGGALQTLHNLGGYPADAQGPMAGLIKASDGVFYGTAPLGGSNDFGALFKVTLDGGYSVFHDFLRNPERTGVRGLGGLLETHDGLFGATEGGGVFNRGSLYKIQKNGSGYTTIYSFGSAQNDGWAPAGGLLQANDGMFYGATTNGGKFQSGTLFRITPQGTAYEILHHFSHALNDGRLPVAPLIQGTDDALYGTTFFGGSNNLGAVFRLLLNGSNFTLIHSFSTNNYDGQFPEAALLQASDGFLYGTTTYGGSNAGTLFKIGADGSGYAVLRHFCGRYLCDGIYPRAPLLEGNDGMLYGTTSAGATPGSVFKIGKDGNGYAPIHNFNLFQNDGFSVFAGLIKGPGGFLYGVTTGGGTNKGGTVFRMKEDGSGHQILHSFGTNGVDGRVPHGRLTFGSEGALYGATYNGGDVDIGTLFKLWLPETPEMLEATLGIGSAQAVFSGATGALYQVSRSADLTNWSVLGTITMPPSGVYTNLDLSPPPWAAFYRVAWVP